MTVCVRVYIFDLFWCRLSIFVFPASIGGVVGADGVIIAGLKHSKHLGALSGLIMFTLRAGTTSHHDVCFFLVKILTICCKATSFSSPIYLIGVASTRFDRHFPILETAFIIAYVVDMKNILFEFGKFDHVC